VKWTGDGVLATFDGPARAVRSAVAIRARARAVGLEVRAGIHTGVPVPRHQPLDRRVAQPLDDQGLLRAGGEDTTRSEAFVIDASEPAILLGRDTGANPAEYLLNALAACLTISIVYVATARKAQLLAIGANMHLAAVLNMERRRQVAVA
jgi:hypothetical protein